jgi:Holliday junction resolvase RusA-like endonuclease
MSILKRENALLRLRVRELNGRKKTTMELAPVLKKCYSEGHSNDASQAEDEQYFTSESSENIDQQVENVQNKSETERLIDPTIQLDFQIFEKKPPVKKKQDATFCCCLCFELWPTDKKHCKNKCKDSERIVSLRMPIKQAKKDKVGSPSKKKTTTKKLCLWCNLAVGSGEKHCSECGGPPAKFCKVCEQVIDKGKCTNCKEE